MINKKEIDKMLSRLGRKAIDNASVIEQFFKKNNVENKDYLFVLTDEKYDENKCFNAAISLVSCGKTNINVVGDFGYNFIQNAMYGGYSSNFVVDLINYCGNFKGEFNVNHRDEDGDTMVHTAIYADEFKCDILRIYKTIIKYGFDSRLKDNDGRNIVEAMKSENRRCGKFSNEEISEVTKLYNKEVERLNEENSEEFVVKEILDKMGYDLKVNEEILREEFGKLNIDNNRYLFELTDDLHNELSCFAAIKALLKFSVCSPNEKDENGYNFIQNAMYAGYGTAFINGCVDASYDVLSPYKLDVNHRDEDGDTMLHTAIYCNDKCVLDIDSVYEKLLVYGFDSSIKDKDGRNIVEAMVYEKKRCNKFSEDEILKVKAIYNENVSKSSKSFSIEELNRNKRLKKEGLEDFLSKCKR